MHELDSIKYLKSLVIKFRDDRKWLKYHNPKDLAISIAIEAAELLELFQWKSIDEVAELAQNKEFIERVSDEIADIFIYILSLVDIMKINLGEATIRKIKKNEVKYPIKWLLKWMLGVRRQL